MRGEDKKLDETKVRKMRQDEMKSCAKETRNEKKLNK